MIDFIHEFIAPGFTAVISAAIGYIVWNLKQQRLEQKEARKAQNDAAEEAKKELDAIKKGLMLELRKGLLEDHERYCVQKESMQPLTYETVCEVHEAYKALGGNGMTDKIFHEIQNVHLSSGGI